MRPQYLKIEGLQSFNQIQNIDFEMLGENGLFGIFGPTGSGKSTILDAITLALYGNVLRANRGTYSIINTHSSRAYVSFAFNVKKANERITYKVERLYKKKKGDSRSSELKLARLSIIANEIETVIADKDREVTSKINDILGLNLNDFTRAVVLPQNKFQDFLMLSKAEKRDMIERLFCLEDYGRSLSEKVNKAFANIEKEILGEEGAISALGEISEEKVKETKENVDILNEEKECLSKTLKTLEKEYRNMQENRSLTIEYERISNLLKTHLEDMKQYSEKKRIAEKAEKANRLNEHIQSFFDISNNVENTEKEFVTLKEEVEKLTVKNNTLTEEKNNFNITYDKESNKIMELKSKYQNLLEVEENINEGIRKKDELKKEVNDIKEKKERLTNEIDTLKKKYGICDIEMKSINKNTEALFIEPGYRKDMYLLLGIAEKIREEKLNLSKINEAIGVYKEELDLLKMEYKKTNDKTEEYNNQLNIETNKYNDMETTCPVNLDDISVKEKELYKIYNCCENINEAKVNDEKIKLKIKENEKQLSINNIEKEKNKEVLFKLEKEYNNMQIQKEKHLILHLAQNLQKGDQCPICGSKDHPNPADISILACEETDNLDEVQKEREKLKEILSDIERKEILFREKLDNLKEKRREIKEQRESLTKQLLDSDSKFNTEYTNNMDCFIKGIEQEILQDKNDYENWEKAKKDLNEKASNIKEYINNLTQKSQVLLTKINNVEKNLEEKNLDKKNNEKILYSQTIKYDQLHKQYNVKGDIKTEIEKIEKKEKEVSQLQKRKKDLEFISEELDNKINSMETELGKIAEEHISVISNLANIKNNIEKENRKIEDVFGTRKVNIKELLEKLNVKLSLLKEKKDTIEKESASCQERLHSKRSKYEALERQMKIYTDSKIKMEQELNRKIEKNNFKNIDDCVSAVLSQDHIDNLNLEIDLYEKKLHALKTEEKLIKEKLEDNFVTKEQWESIKIRCEDLTVKNEEYIYKYSKIKSEYDSLLVNYDKYKKISKNLKIQKNKKDKVCIIQKLLKGNSFVEYVAEERLRYVTKRASDILGELTKYRYNLELDINNDYVVRDNLNGGVCRLVTTLSGGEIFLTSLSLALALSEQIQLKGQSPLEFFFLDEGFGTLDSNLIDIVMDSLIRFISKDRIIGLISHVPDLRERVSMKLSITPPDGYGLGTKVEICR